MNTESMKEFIKRELPALLRADPEFLRYVLDLLREVPPDHEAGDDRFGEALAELRPMREESDGAPPGA